MRVLEMALAGLLVLTASTAAHAAPQGPKTRPVEAGPAAGTVQVRDGHGSSWRPAPGSRGNGWHPPQWGPSRYYGGWVPYGGPGVPLIGSGEPRVGRGITRSRIGEVLTGAGATHSRPD
jgi:hypothetical protein